MGWPIGAFYVWHAQDDFPTKPRIGPLPQRRLDGFSGFLLDGQQRLTSISLAIRAESEAGLHQRGFFDIQNEEFYLGEMKRTVTKRIEAGDPSIVPLSDMVLMRDGDTDLHAVEHIIQSLRDRNEFGIGTTRKWSIDGGSKRLPQCCVGQHYAKSSASVRRRMHFNCSPALTREARLYRPETSLPRVSLRLRRAK